jgi:hypothetical protein
MSEFQIASVLICRDEAGPSGIKWDGGPVRTRPDEGGQARLCDLGSLSSGDVFFVAVAEQEKVFVAHEISPFRGFRFTGNGSKRADFGAFLCLAAMRFSRLLCNAIARY